MLSQDQLEINGMTLQADLVEFGNDVTIKDDSADAGESEAVERWHAVLKDQVEIISAHTKSELKKKLFLIPSDRIVAIIQGRIMPLRQEIIF